MDLEAGILLDRPRGLGSGMSGTRDFCPEPRLVEGREVL